MNFNYPECVKQICDNVGDHFSSTLKFFSERFITNKQFTKYTNEN